MPSITTHGWISLFHLCDSSSLNCDGSEWMYFPNNSCSSNGKRILSTEAGLEELKERWKLKRNNNKHFYTWVGKTKQRTLLYKNGERTMSIFIQQGRKNNKHFYTRMEKEQWTYWYKYRECALLHQNRERTMNTFVYEWRKNNEHFCIQMEKEQWTLCIRVEKIQWTLLYKGWRKNNEYFLQELRKNNGHFL